MHDPSSLESQLALDEGNHVEKRTAQSHQITSKPTDHPFVLHLFTPILHITVPSIP
jgi:hypothetical protein